MGDVAYFKIPQILLKESWPLPVWPKNMALEKNFLTISYSRHLITGPAPHRAPCPDHSLSLLSPGKVVVITVPSACEL